MTATKTASPKLSDAECLELYNRAWLAGQAKATGTTPVAMVVGTPTTMFGNDLDPNKPQYYVADGVCGFAWVVIRPGNSRFANWLKKNGHGRKDSYYGGVTVWISDYNQSMQRKEAHAGAFARVLQEAGINAHSMSRMD